LEKIACLLVHSGDRGKWLWPFWHRWYAQNWNCGDVLDTVFLSETEDFDITDSRIITDKTGRAPWGSGLIHYLKRCPYKYVMYHHEDYFIDRQCQPDIVKRIITVMEQAKLNLVKCCGYWAGDPDWERSDRSTILNYPVGDFPIVQYPQKHAYLISHQSSIWNKEFLLSTIQPQYTPWCHELEGTDALRSLDIPVHIYPGPPPVPYSETVQSGKIRRGAEYLFPEGINDKAVKEHLL